MDFIQELMQDVQQEAMARNHEVIASVFTTEEVNICEWGKLWWRLKSIGRSLHKLNDRISEKQHPGYHRRFNHEGSLCEKVDDLLSQKEELTQEMKNDNITLNNLTRCGTCNGCKYVHTDQEYHLRMNKGWKKYTVQELKAKPVGTVFEHETLGQCWIEENLIVAHDGSSSIVTCMVFHNGYKAYFMQGEMKPWNEYMRESPFVFICEGEEGQ